MPADSRQQQLVHELLEIDRAVMEAIAAKDPHRLAPLLAETFTLKTPGAPEVSREAFLDAIAALGGEVLSIAAQETTALVVGDGGVVSGVQIAQVRLFDGGKVVTSQSVYTDVYERHDGRWRLRFAFSIELPAPAADAAPVSS